MIAKCQSIQKYFREFSTVSLLDVKVFYGQQENPNVTMDAVVKPSGKINWSYDEWSGKCAKSKAKVQSGNCIFLYPTIIHIPLCTVKQIF